MPSLRALALLPLLALTGCNQAPSLSHQAAASPSPSQKSATPNSFDDVTAQLDSGGDLYFYLSTAQWLAKLSNGVDTIHDLLLSGTQNIPNRAEAEKTFALVKDIVQKSGLQEITGIGGSSFAISPDLHRNKLFIHHYPDKGAGLLWSLGGKAPHPLAGLDFLPLDTASAGFGDFDLAQLINFLRQEVNQSDIPEAKQALTQWQTQFAGITGLQLDDVLQSLNGSMGMVITLDATDTISIPSQAKPQTIPTPRLALLIAVKNDLIFKQIDKMAGGNPGVIKVDEPDLKMRTMPIPMSPLPGLTLRPSVAQWNGFLILASDDKLIHDMVAVQKGGSGFKSTPEFATLSAGLPQEGNSFGLCTQRFADTLRRFQGQMFANQPGATPAQTAIIERMLSEYQNAGHFFSVGSQLPNGCLSISQGSRGASQVLAPLIIAPAAVGAGMAAGAIHPWSTSAHVYHPQAAPSFSPASPGASQ